VILFHFLKVISVILFLCPLQDSCNEALAGEPILPPPEAALYSPEALAKAARTAGAGGGAGKEFEKSVDVLEDLFDKLFHLNKKLELQEEDIFRLGLFSFFNYLQNTYITYYLFPTKFNAVIYVREFLAGFM
jgi:hypothetical protein